MRNIRLLVLLAPLLLGACAVYPARVAVAPVAPYAGVWVPGHWGWHGWHRGQWA